MTDETANLTEALTKRLWFSFKAQLLAKLPAEGFWIRPMYLLRAIRASSNQVHLLATLPANGRIVTAAQGRLPMMRQLLAPNFNLSLTKYPDEYEIAEAQRRYGIDIAPKPWARKRGT